MRTRLAQMGPGSLAAAALATLVLVSGLSTPVRGETPDDHWWDGFGVYAETGLPGTVNALVTFRDTIIAVGEFWDPRPEKKISCVAKWDGSTWLSVRRGVHWYAPPCEETCAPWINDAVVWQGDLVVGGRFSYAGGFDRPEYRANYIARWDGTRWYPLGSGLNGSVEHLAVYQGDLIAFGLFTEAGGSPVRNVARWDGWGWHPLGEVNGLVYHSTIFDGDLVAVGPFNEADGSPVNHIARWNGSAWSPIGNQRIYDQTDVVVYQDRLVAAVDHLNDGVLFTAVSYWDGTSWVPMGARMGAPALAEYNGDLIAAGNFPANAYRSENIARWNGTAWQPMGSGVYRGYLEGAWANALLVHRGSLYVGGNFTQAGGKPSYYVARWDDTLTPVVVEALEGVSTGGVVRLVWRLSHESLPDLLGIHVDRSSHREGPYEERTSEALRPETTMSFAESVDGEGPYWYRLRLASLDGTTSFAGPIEVGVDVRLGPGLRLAAIAIPAAGAPVAIRYGLERDYARVNLQVFAANGRLVRWLGGGPGRAGEHVRYWDRRNDAGIEVPRGVYWVQLTADGQSASQRLVLLGR